MWLVKNDLPEPEGPRINLLRLVITPVFIGRSEISRWTGFPVRRSTMRIPNGESESLPDVSSTNRHNACSMKVWKLSSAGKSPALPGIAAQNSVGRSTVLWRGFASMSASWLPTSFFTRFSFSRSSLHAITLQCARIEVSPLLWASFRYSSIHSRFIWLERL